MMMDDPELLRLFKVESEEHLARLDECLLRLEQTPDDAALLDEAFRESHSLKGAARMLGMSGIEAAAHGLESVFNAARKGEAQLTPESIEAMNAALTDLERRVREALAGGAKPAPPDPAPDVNPAFGQESGPGPAQTEQCQPEPAAWPASAALASPPPEPAAAGAPEAVAAPEEGGPAEVRPATPDPPRSPSGVLVAAPSNEPYRIETVRVETRKLDDLLTQVGELSVIRGRGQHRLSLVQELLSQWEGLQRGGPLAGQGGARAVEAGQRFGELLALTRSALFDDNARLEATSRRLEDQVRGMRLLPLSNVFGLFPRMVRDTAKELGKEADLVVEGGEITEDKHILESLKDPLMHLLRNAICHGIETPDEREGLGKPRRGVLRLSAARQNGSVLLSVEDDGRGLDTGAIRQAALSRGLYTEAELAAMSATQIHQLIFQPSLSTSRFVTELAGRGVGLDAVRVSIERMKGDIRLESRAGQGLAVRLRLPQGLTTTRILLAEAAGRLHGLPAEFVHTSRGVRATEIFTLEGRSAILLDGAPVPVSGLAALLGLPAGEPRESLACIVIQVGEERHGLLADELIGEEEVVPKPLGPPLKRVRNVSALAMLGNGELCAVLNPADLLREARAKVAQPGAAPAAARGEKSRPAILLVEDSSLIRAMEKRILEDGGYEVTTAVDGLDALNILGAQGFAAIVSDITMPNLDGLALTARVRADARLKDLPVVLVTTLASDEDKRRGLEAGASAYLPKPSFDQRVLLDTLNRLVAR